MPEKIQDGIIVGPKRSPKWPRLCLAVLLIRLGVQAAASASAQNPPEPYKVLLQSATNDTSAGRFVSAKSALEEAIALSPSRFEAWTQLGLLYDRVDDFKDAERALRRSLQLDPERAQTHYLLGRTLIANPGEGLDWPAAMKEFREVLRLNDKDSEAMDRLGVGLMALGKKEEAVTVLQAAVLLTPQNAAQQFDLGLALESNNDLKGATEHYRLSLAARPDYAEAASALGKVLFTQGQFEESEKWLRTALKINPDMQDAHQAFGRLLRKQGKQGQAQHEFEEAAALDQRIQDATESTQLSNGALAKAAKGDFAGAEDDLRKAVRLRADGGIAHYNLGLILADRQRLAAAAQQLSIAISLMPTRAQPWISLARVQSKLDQTEAARRSIALALELAPADANAQREAKALEATPSKPAASAETSPALPYASLTVDTVASHKDLAGRLEEQGDWQDASGQWLRVLKLEPGAEFARLQLALCLQQSGNLAGAILEGSKALLVNPESVRGHVELATSLLAAGQQVEARAELQDALRLAPNNPAAKALLLQIPAP